MKGSADKVEAESLSLRGKKASAAYSGSQGSNPSQSQVGPGMRVKTTLPQLVINDGQNQTPQSLSSYKNNQGSFAQGQVPQHQLSHRQPSGQGAISTSISSIAASSSAQGVAKNNIPGLGGNTRTRNNIGGMAYQQQHHTTAGAAGSAQRMLRQPDGSYNYNSSKGFKSNFASFNDE